MWPWIDGLPFFSHEQAVYYFSRIASLFQTLPTYEWLTKHGIETTSDRTFTPDEFSSAIQAEWGYLPAIDCKVVLFPLVDC